MGEALDVAKLLRDARVHAGLSQTDLGERTGIAQPNISAYESGRRTPTVRTLVALLDACGVELSWRARRPPPGPPAATTAPRSTAAPSTSSPASSPEQPVTDDLG